MRERKNKVLLILLLVASIQGMSQFSVGITISGIAFHPSAKDNAHIYKWKFDKSGRFVAYAGISLMAEYRVNKYIGIKVLQNLVFYDCAGKFAGLTHFGINVHDEVFGLENQNHKFSASFGPLWYYRKGWTNIESYKNNPSFLKLSNSGQWESTFVWYGAQIYYDYFSSKTIEQNLSSKFRNSDLSINFLPAYPHLYTFGIGKSFYFTK
jgi:hypothetical protein